MLCGYVVYRLPVRTHHLPLEASEGMREVLLEVFLLPKEEDERTDLRFSRNALLPGGSSLSFLQWESSATLHSPVP